MKLVVVDGKISAVILIHVVDRVVAILCVVTAVVGVVTVMVVHDVGDMDISILVLSLQTCKVYQIYSLIMKMK